METYGGLNVGNYSPPLGPLTKLEEEFKTLVEQGDPFVFVAHMLEDLALKMGLDLEAFQRSVEPVMVSAQRDGMTGLPRTQPISSR